MTDTTPEKTTTPKAASKKRQHVAVEASLDPGAPIHDVVVFGQKLDALEFIVDQISSDWRYVAVEHGQSVAEALKAASS